VNRGPRTCTLELDLGLCYIILHALDAAEKMNFPLLGGSLSFSVGNVNRGEAANARKRRMDFQSTTLYFYLRFATTMQSKSESLDIFSSTLFSCSSISIDAGYLRGRLRKVLFAVAFSASYATSSTSCVLNTNFPFNATRLLVVRFFRIWIISLCFVSSVRSVVFLLHNNSAA
jgi:hypothetical protein